MSDENKTEQVEEQTPENPINGLLNILSEDVVKDFEKFFIKGQKAAGKRVRAAMTLLQKEAKAIKALVTQKRNELKANKA